LVSYRDIESLDLQQLKIMRNEIYARHGCIFTAPDLIEHFAKAPWYRGTMSDVTSKLSDIERINIEHIKHLESARVAPQNVIGGIQLARKSKKLQHNGIPVRNVVLYMQYQTYQGCIDTTYITATGWAVVFYDNAENSWSIYEIDVDSLLQPEYVKQEISWEDERAYDVNNGLITKLVRGLLQEQAVELISNNQPILRGKGASPNITLGDEGVIALHGRVSHFPDVRFFGDSLAAPYDEDIENNSAILYPTASSPGRVKDVIVREVVSHEPYHLLYRAADGAYHWYQLDLEFQPPGKILKTIACSAALCCLTESKGMSSWFIISERYPEGRRLPIPANTNFMVSRETGESSLVWRISPITLGKLGDALRYVIDLENALVFTLPAGTKKLQDDDIWGLDMIQVTMPKRGNVTLTIGQSDDGETSVLEVTKDEKVLLRIKPQ
jgi:hypothetical protein